MRDLRTRRDNSALFTEAESRKRSADAGEARQGRRTAGSRKDEVRRNGQFVDLLSARRQEGVELGREN